MPNALMFHSLGFALPWLQPTLAEPEQGTLELVVLYLVENGVEYSAIFMPRKDWLRLSVDDMSNNEDG